MRQNLGPGQSSSHTTVGARSFRSLSRRASSASWRRTSAAIASRAFSSDYRRRCVASLTRRAASTLRCTAWPALSRSMSSRWHAVGCAMAGTEQVGDGEVALRALALCNLRFRGRSVLTCLPKSVASRLGSFSSSQRRLLAIFAFPRFHWKTWELHLVFRKNRLSLSLSLSPFLSQIGGLRPLFPFSNPGKTAEHVPGP